MQCNEVRNHFADYVNEALAPTIKAELSQHLQECAACNADMAELTGIWVRVGAVPAGEPAWQDMEVRFRAVVDEAKHQRRSWWRQTPLRIAAVLVAGVLVSLPFVKTLVFPANVYAIVEAVDGPLYRVEGGKERALAAGERIGVGISVRTNAGAKAILKLPDGARIEMHPESELSLERESGGTRVRLNDGIVNVKPARQPLTTLYVQNREVTAPVTVAAEPEPRFEVASIRMVVPLSERIGQRGATPGAETRRAVADPRVGPRCVLPFNITLDPGRLIIEKESLWTLVALAYGNPCPLEKDLTGGNMWIQGDLYQVQALTPAGTPAYTKTDFLDGKAPKLQRMLQNLLSDRFKLKLGREMKEFPAYNLVMIKEGKLKIADPNRAPDPWPSGPARVRLGLGNSSMTRFAVVLSEMMNRHVIDKTGAKGQYDINIEGPPIVQGETSLQQMQVGLADSLEEQLGLKLESTKALVELLVIENAERPSEN